MKLSAMINEVDYAISYKSISDPIFYSNFVNKTSLWKDKNVTIKQKTIATNLGLFLFCSFQSELQEAKQNIPGCDKFQPVSTVKGLMF